jgi:hypothetical protein
MRAAIAAAGLVALAACSQPMFRPPAGPGLPAPDAGAAWEQATKSCRGAKNLAAALRVSGRAGDESFPSISVDAALDDEGSIYLSAMHTGQALFLLAGRADRATLWLRKDNRAVTDAPAAIIDRMLGVGLAPTRLLAVLTGCAARSFEVRQAERLGRLLRIETADAVVFLEQQQGSWRTHAALVDGFTIQFQREGTSVPQRILIAADPGRPPARLDIRLSEAELNGTLPAGIFTPPAGAANAEPLSLSELRRVGGGD